MNSFRTPRLRTCLCILLVAYEQPVCFASELPAAARLLVEKRAEAIRRIDATFVAELEKLKASLTKSGAFESAVAVDDLLKQTRASTTDDTLSLDGKWRYRFEGKPLSMIRNFKGNFMIDEAGAKHPWVLEGGGITINYGGGAFEKLKLDLDNRDVIKGVNHQGMDFTYTRIK